MDFSSDNSFGVHPSILAAIAGANGGSVPSYGGDELTARVNRRFCEIFETEVTVFLVPTGTAANVLSVATFCSPIGSVFAHDEAHLTIEEGGAAEFYTGGAKVIPIKGANGQIDPATLMDQLAEGDAYGSRTMVPMVLSLTQPTECGTLYPPDAIAALVEIARARNMAVHMDGARFANAVVALGCSPADLTWRLGVDVLSFGATKNGAMSVEAVVLFEAGRADEMDRRRLRAGHLLSKTRFMAAQLDAYLRDDLWLEMAAHANAMAARLSLALAALPNVSLAWPTQANEVFAVMPNGLCAHLEDRGARFHSWSRRGLAGAAGGPPGAGEDLRRMICSFETSEASVEVFVNIARGFNG
ncbi:Low-specificity L-threonine aldolase [hydrothermal vent metagenome]|uniref:Low-specificity L-threonine aldolase n=1 Tax=hydrothermal vent metagenome TaxID=652676 RepID=A0A3B0TH09_9ZZZZ